MTEPRAPVIGEFVRGVGTLLEIRSVPPPPEPPPTIVYVFEDVSAEMRIMIGADILDTGSRYTDLYGVGTAVDQAIMDAKRYMLAHKITAKSDLEIVVAKITGKDHQVRSSLDKENFYDKDYCAFQDYRPDGNWITGDNTVEIVWSSRNHAKPARKTRIKK